jgi:Ca2+-binding RTX toxin-like protein
MVFDYSGTNQSNYYFYQGVGNIWASGNDGNDTIIGNIGKDKLFGGNGNDRLVANGSSRQSFANDDLLGGSGDDTLFGSDGNNILQGNEGNDILIGALGSDALWGYEGNDRLMAGSSTTVNSKEYDQLWGATGADEFILCNNSGNNYYQGLGYATITDYTSQDSITIKRGSMTLKQEHWTGSSSKLDTVIYQGNDQIAVLTDYTGTVYANYI